MPDDEVRSGQVRDYLGYMMNGLDSAISSLKMQAYLKDAVDNFKRQNRQLKLSIMEVIEDYETSLDELFQRPDIIGALPLDMEDKVIQLAAESRKKADKHFSTGLVIEEQLNSVLAMFEDNQPNEQTDAEENLNSDDAVTLF